MERLSWNHDKQGDMSRVAFKGSIDEYSGHPLLKLADELLPHALLNLRDISMVNSSGIKNLLIFVRAAKARSQLTFEECSPILARQLAMVPALREGVTIDSLLLTFMCNDCSDSELDILVQTKDRETEPSALCPECAKPMVVEDEVLLHLLTNVRK